MWHCLWSTLIIAAANIERVKKFKGRSALGDAYLRVKQNTLAVSGKLALALKKLEPQGPMIELDKVSRVD